MASIIDHVNCEGMLDNTLRNLIHRTNSDNILNSPHGHNMIDHINCDVNDNRFENVRLL